MIPLGAYVTSYTGARPCLAWHVASHENALFCCWATVTDMSPVFANISAAGITEDAELRARQAKHRSYQHCCLPWLLPTGPGLNRKK